MSAAAPDTPSNSDVEPSANLPPSPPLSPPKASTASASKSACKGRGTPQVGDRKAVTARPTATADRLVHTLDLHRRGKLHSSGDWLAYRVSSREHEQFETQLRGDPVLLEWYEEKVRHDWDPEQGTLVLRMPSALHERFTACVEDAIGNAIDRLAAKLHESEDETDGKVAEELRKIYKGRSTTLELHVPQLEGSSQSSEDDGKKGKIVKRSPDATFYHPSQPHLPTLVVEIARSQKQNELARLAESYVIDSSHAIKAVLGFKIPYLSRETRTTRARPRCTDKSPFYSLWRAEVEVDEDAGTGKCSAVGVCSEVETKPLSASNGGPPATTIDLTLSDLLPSESPVLEAASRRAITVSLPIGPMVDLIRESEGTRHVPGTAIAQPPRSAPMKFRKRKRTPSEDLSDGREQSFRQQEANELQKSADVDGEYIEERRRTRRKKEINDAEGVGTVEETSAGREDNARVWTLRDTG